MQKISGLGLEVGKALADISEQLTQEVQVLATLREAVVLERKELEQLHKIDLAATGHLSIKLCLSDSCGGLETRLEHGIELVKYGSDILGQALPFALLERRDGEAELER